MEFRETQAIYLQIADYICEAILKEKWQGGARIPSVRELAVSMEVNPNTAMRTFNYLQEKGIIYNKRGIGYFITEDGKEKTMDLKKQEFIEEEIPRFIRTMKLLGIDIPQLEKFYSEID